MAYIVLIWNVLVFMLCEVPILELCCEKNVAINTKEQNWQVRQTENICTQKLLKK
jgi:hypothetical protein